MSALDKQIQQLQRG
jgi:serine/threonine-protein phosphatase 4 catalytic subunit